MVTAMVQNAYIAVLQHYLIVTNALNVRVRSAGCHTPSSTPCRSMLPCDEVGQRLCARNPS